MTKMALQSSGERIISNKSCCTSLDHNGSKIKIGPLASYNTQN